MGPDLHGTDLELVQTALTGDAGAYRALVERHERRVYRFLLKRVMRQDDAEDLTQETFLQAYRSLASYQRDAQFTTWLIGIALNVARNHHNRSHLPPGEGDDVLEALPADGPDPAESVAQKAMLRALQRGIAGLPLDQRECLTLIALEGIGYEDASRILGVPVGTVKSRLSRARAKLAELIRNH